MCPISLFLPKFLCLWKTSHHSKLIFSEAELKLFKATFLCSFHLNVFMVGDDDDDDDDENIAAALFRLTSTNKFLTSVLTQSVPHPSLPLSLSLFLFRFLSLSLSLSPLSLAVSSRLPSILFSLFLLSHCCRWMRFIVAVLLSLSLSLSLPLSHLCLSLFTQLSLIYFSLGNIHDTNNLGETRQKKKRSNKIYFLRKTLQRLLFISF